MVDSIYTAARAYGSAEKKSASMKAALVDILVADGVKPGFQKQQDLGDGRKGYLPAAQSCRDGLLASFGKAAVRIYNTDTKELSDAERAEKRNITQQLGSRMGKINAALDGRLNPVDRMSVERKPDDVWLRDAFNAFVKRVETSEGAGDLDLVEIMEWLKKSPLNTFQPK